MRNPCLCNFTMEILPFACKKGNTMPNELQPTEHPAAEFLAGLSLGAALTGASAAQGAKLAKAARDMRNRQKAYFKHRGDMLLAEAKNAEADVDRLLADIFPVPKQGQLL